MKPLRVVVLHEDGRREVQEIDRATELHTMQQLVGGWVQAIGYGDVVYWCDEEGKYKPHEVNQVATAHCVKELAKTGHVMMPGDYLSGTVVITGRADARGNAIDVPAWVIDELLDNRS